MEEASNRVGEGGFAVLVEKDDMSGGKVEFLEDRWQACLRMPAYQRYVNFSLLKDKKGVSLLTRL